MKMHYFIALILLINVFLSGCFLHKGFRRTNLIEDTDLSQVGVTGGGGQESNYHLVCKGDTIYSIARTYSLSVDMLCRVNRLSSDSVIYPGQKLLISSMPVKEKFWIIERRRKGGR